MTDTRLLIFFAVVTSVTILLHAYVGLRLLRPAFLARRWRVAGWAVLFLMASLMLLAFLGARFIGRTPGFAAIQWGGYLSMGLILVLFPLAVVRDVALTGHTALRGLTRRFQGQASRPHDVDLSRRDFLRRASSGAVLGTSGVLTAAGLVSARRTPEVKRVEIPIEGLASDLEGFRILQITDLHLGPTLGGDYAREVVERVNEREPDLIAFTGDLADGYVKDLRDDVAPLADLRARHGVYFVTGNHEYYWELDPWLDEVRGLGLTVLHNEHRVVDVGAAQLLVGGITDFSAGRMVPSHRSDPGAALRGAPPVDFKLLLAHQPKSLFAARDAGFDLQLSGHTHGGQFFPWNLFVHLAHPIAVGLGRFDGLWVYVSRGTGYWGPPVRTLAGSEITEVVLGRGAARHG